MIWTAEERTAIWCRAGQILAEKGFATTPYLVAGCEANKGSFKTSVREYRLPTEADWREALQIVLDR